MKIAIAQSNPYMELLTQEAFEVCHVMKIAMAQSNPYIKLLTQEAFEVCHVMKIAMAQSNPYMELLTQEAFEVCHVMKIAIVQSNPYMELLTQEAFEVCHVMKIAIAQSNPYMELLTQEAFYFSSSVLTSGNKMPMKTVSVASDWGLYGLYFTHNNSLWGKSLTLNPLAFGADDGASPYSSNVGSDVAITKLYTKDFNKISCFSQVWFWKKCYPTKGS